MSLSVESRIDTSPRIPLQVESNVYPGNQRSPDSVQASPEYSALLEQFDTSENPYFGILIRQGIERATLAIDVIELVKSPDTKEKMLRQADANAVKDAMIHHLLFGLAVPHPTSEEGTTQRARSSPLSDVDLLREAKGIDIERLLHPPGEIFTADDDLLLVEADAFGSGFELVIKNYEQKLLQLFQDKVLFFHHNS